MKANVDRIINKACELWGVSYEDVFGRRRDMPLPLARAMIVKTIRDIFDLTHQRIGEFVGRNHSSVYYYYKMYDTEYKYNREFRNFANAMKEVVMEMRTDFQEELDEELKEIIG